MAVDSFEWDTLDLEPYKLIYISYGSMHIGQKDETDTYQTRPYFLRANGEILSPYLCISIDAYSEPRIHTRNEYTLVQIPSRHISDLRPITEKLVSMLNQKPKNVRIEGVSQPYLLYICNFIKFKHHSDGNGEIELEGNRIADYLGDYATHFYHWMGYSLYLGEYTFPFNLPDWLYKHDCIHHEKLHHLISMNAAFRESMQQGKLMEMVSYKKKDPSLFEKCFININEHKPKGGRKTRKYKKKIRKSYKKKLF